MKARNPGIPLLAGIAILLFGVIAIVLVVTLTRSGVPRSPSTEPFAGAGVGEATASSGSLAGAEPRVEPRPPAQDIPPPAPGIPVRNSYAPILPPAEEQDERVESVASVSGHDERLEAVTSVRERRLSRSMEMLNRRAAAAAPARR